MGRSASRSWSRPTPSWISRQHCSDDPIAVVAVARPAVEEQPAAPRFELEAGNAPSAASSHVVRVDLARLDDLMRQVGDLVISRARLLESLSRIEPYVPAAEWRTAQENAVAIDRQLRALREGLMRVRLVPVGEIFRRMPFVVRDLARETGRKVTLLLQGQSTEIDKYLIERMMDPVLHLVRNAVSHGIEPPDERIRQGKRPEGTITLSASAAGELVTIEIADDGRGVDAERRRRARAAGRPACTARAGRFRDSPRPSVLAGLFDEGRYGPRQRARRGHGGREGHRRTVVRRHRAREHAWPGHAIHHSVAADIGDRRRVDWAVGTESFAVPQSAVREVLEVAATDIRRIEGNEIIPYHDGLSRHRPAGGSLRHRRRDAAAISRLCHLDGRRRDRHCRRPDRRPARNRGADDCAPARAG